MTLSPEQLRELQVDLDALRLEIREALAGSAEAARPVELDQAAVGRVSRIDAIQQQKMLEANRAALQQRGQQIRSALQRLERSCRVDLFLVHFRDHLAKTRVPAVLQRHAQIEHLDSRGEQLFCVRILNAVLQLIAQGNGVL